MDKHWFCVYLLFVVWFIGLVVLGDEKDVERRDIHHKIILKSRKPRSHHHHHNHNHSHKKRQSGHKHKSKGHRHRDSQESFEDSSNYFDSNESEFDDHTSHKSHHHHDFKSRPFSQLDFQDVRPHVLREEWTPLLSAEVPSFQVTHQPPYRQPEPTRRHNPHNHHNYDHNTHHHNYNHNHHNNNNKQPQKRGRLPRKETRPQRKVPLQIDLTTSYPPKQQPYNYYESHDFPPLIPNTYTNYNQKILNSDEITNAANLYEKLIKKHHDRNRLNNNNSHNNTYEVLEDNQDVVAAKIQNSLRILAPSLAPVPIQVLDGHESKVEAVTTKLVVENTPRTTRRPYRGRTRATARSS